MNKPAKLAILERALSTIAGVPVEITIRGPLNFTWSTEQRNEDAIEKLVAYAKTYTAATLTTHHDDEAGSFLYVDVVPAA